jgi:signal transduction histidine kinase/ligand-binding sensor domain-containing protein
VAAAHAGPGQQRENAGYTVRSWDESAGLPLAEASRLLLARDGFLWLGTKSGVLQFDGDTFRASPIAGLPPRELDWVYGLAQSADGLIWCAVRGHPGLSRYDGRRWRIGLWDQTLGTVRTIVSPSDGPLLIGSEKGLFSLSRQGQLVLLASKNVLGGIVESVAFKNADEILVGTDSGLVRWHKGGVDRIAGISRGTPVHTILPWSDGAFVGTADGLVRTDGVTSRVLDPTSGIPRTRVYALATTTDGQLWVGTRFGLFRSQDAGRTFAGMTGPGGTPVGIVWDLIADRYNRVWVASKTGLHLYRPSRFVSFQMPPSGPGRPTTAGAAVRLLDGSFFVGHEQGLARLRLDATGEARWQNWSVEDGLCVGGVLALAPDRDGAVWLGGQPGDRAPALCRFDGRRFTSLSLPGGSVIETTRSLLIDADGVLWAGGHRLYRVSGERVDVVSLPNVNKQGVHFVIERIALGPDGTLWVMTREGVWRRPKDGAFERVAVGGRPLVAWINDVAFIGDDIQLWVGERGGWLIARDRALPLTSEEGFLDAEIYGAYHLGEKTWLSTAAGVLAVDAESLNLLSAGKVQKLTLERLSQADGLPSSTASPGTRPVPEIDSKGQVQALWFSTLAGLARMPRAGRAARETSPLPKILTLQINGEQQDDPYPRKVRGSGAVTVAYTAPGLVDHTSLIFRHRLLPLSPQWQNSGRTLSVRYANLPLGSYRFEVSAARRDSPWSQATSMAFVLQPAWFETRTFHVAISALLVLFIAGLYQLRIWRIRLRAQAAADERLRIARELHDTLTQSVSSIAFRLEEARLSSDELTGHARDIVDQAWHTARSTVKEARQAIWRLRQGAGTSGDFVKDLRALVTRIDGKVPIRITSHPAVIALSTRVSTALLRIAQEGVLNALRHAQPKHIDVEIRASDGMLSFRIADDGSGFAGAPPERPGHYGIIGIHERARDLGAELITESAPGKGTHITLNLPLKTDQGEGDDA